MVAGGLAGVHGPEALASGLASTTLAAAQTLFSRQTAAPESVPVRETREGLGLEFAWEVAD